MKFLTEEEVVRMYFESSGRFGPAGEVVKFAEQLEARLEHIIMAEVKATLKWIGKESK